jgi:uncharacterized protein (TIGR00369 family)
MIMDIRTHQRIDFEFCGKPVRIGEGSSRVEMIAANRMAVDDTGLVHGGFIFGLADHAAMIAVNHPNVVLGVAEVRFLKPVKVGERILAEARVEKVEGNKRVVPVTVTRGGNSVFSGRFDCFILKKHVLS